jgi:hypothetical protein
MCEEIEVDARSQGGAEGLHFRRDRFQRNRCARDGTQPTCLRDGDGERRSAGARHGCEKEGMLDGEEVERATIVPGSHDHS